MTGVSSENFILLEWYEYFFITFTVPKGNDSQPDKYVR